MLPAIDVAGLWGRRSAVVAAGASSFLFHQTASQKKKRENLRKISRLPPPAPCLGEKLLALRPQRVLPLYTAYLMNNHCVPPSALARPRTLLAVGGGEAAGLDSSKAHFIICGLNLAE